VLGFDELFRKIDETIAVGGVQLLLQGGHNPDLPLSWYEDLFRAVKQRYPEFKLHALSPPEVIHLSRLSQLPVPEIIRRLIDAGLDSIPGGGAEILVDRVRKLLHCYGKATSDEWLDVMRHAHRAGLRTTATMMYGTLETDMERIEHMMRLRDLQDETGGFTAFITWSFQPDHTELGADHAMVEATGVDLPADARARAHRPDNFDNLQASWVTQGGKVGQLSLVRRQRHGQRDDRRERRPRRRRDIRWTSSRSCATSKMPVHRQAAQHALPAARRSDLPRARRASHDGTRGRSRSRRHAHAGGTAPVSCAAKREERGGMAEGQNRRVLSDLQIPPFCLPAVLQFR
jgi:CofH subfamily radical SAM domain protein